MTSLRIVCGLLLTFARGACWLRGHAGVSASSKLTFDLDHSMKAGHL